MSDKKTLKIKRMFAWAIYNNLKRTAPKDYPTTGEIKSTISDVLPALKDHVAGYSDRFKAAAEFSNKVVAKELTEEEAQKAIDTINADLLTFNREHGEEMVEITLEDEGFKTLKEQFDRDGWGKMWFSSIEEFAEMLTSFEEAAK